MTRILTNPELIRQPRRTPLKERVAFIFQIEDVAVGATPHKESPVLPEGTIVKRLTTHIKATAAPPALTIKGQFVIINNPQSGSISLTGARHILNIADPDKDLLYKVFAAEEEDEYKLNIKVTGANKVISIATQSAGAGTYSGRITVEYELP